MATSLGIKQALKVLGLDESIIESAYPNSQDRKYLKPISELQEKLSLTPEQVQVLTDFQPTKKKVVTKKQLEKLESKKATIKAIAVAESKLESLKVRLYKLQAEYDEAQQEVENLYNSLV